MNIMDKYPDCKEEKYVATTQQNYYQDYLVPSYSREPCFKKIIQVKEMKRWSPSKEQKIIHGQELIEDFCEKMCLSQNVQVLASDLIYQIIDTKPLLGKCLKILVATILYISAKTCRTPRSVKELCNILSMKKKNISRMHSDLMRLKASGKIIIKNDFHIPSNETDVEFFVKYYARALQLSSEAINASSKMAKKLHELDLMPSHQPCTVAAVIIWSIISIKKNDDEGICPDMKQVAKVCMISKNNLRDQFRKKIYPRFLDLIPNDYVPLKQVAQFVIA